MLFNVIKYSYFFLSGLFGILAWRMLYQGRSLSFFGLLFAMQFMINTMFSSSYISVFFEIGEEHLFNDNIDSQHIADLCNDYFFYWTSTYVLNLMPNMCILFCRFIYVRYAHGLVADMGRLFHQLVFLVIAMFSLHSLSLWFTEPILDGVKQSQNVMIKICNHLPLSAVAQEDFVKVFVRPKVMTFVFAFIDVFIIWYFDMISHKQKLYYGIPKTRRNLLTMKEHCTWVKVTVFSITFDQIIKLGLQLLWGFINVKEVFLVWWLWHLLMFTIINILAPFKILRTAMKKSPEFLGYKAKTFPGQEKPRGLCVQPANLVCNVQGNEPVQVTEHQNLFYNRAAKYTSGVGCGNGMPDVDIH